MMSRNFQSEMNMMIEEAISRGVQPKDLFYSWDYLADPKEFFDKITEGTQKDYKEFPFLRIEKNSIYDNFYKTLLAYLDSEGTRNYNYKKLDPAEVRKNNRGEWLPSDGRHRAAFCMFLGIKLPVKRMVNMDEDLNNDISNSELFGTDVLYHATYKPYWEQIKKEGAIKPKAHSNWDISGNCVYLSRDYDNAYSYCETAENIPEEYLDQIVVLEININKLNIDKLDIDHNQNYGNYWEVDVEDPQTWVEFEYEGSIPVSYIKEVHDESINESLNEVYPQKDESKSDFINRFMRATAKEYPNVKQRYAIAYSYWNRRNLKEAIKDAENPKDKSFQDQINEMKGNLKVTLYTAKNGHNYGEEYLKELYRNNKKLCAKMLANIQTFKELGSKTPEKYSKYLENGIFEFRASIATNEARELYFFAIGNNEVLVTNGFTKKEQKTPKEAIDKAKRLREEYYKG